MAFAFSGAFCRYTVVLMLVMVLVGSAILADAFAPLLPTSPRNVATTSSSSNSFLQRPGLVVPECHPSRTPRKVTRRQLQQPLQSNKSNEDGVPSSPLDRPILSAIDAASIFIFAGIGKASHSAVDGSLDVFAVLVTAFPFLVSWFLIAPLVGSYTPEATRDVKSAVIQTGKGWALAIPMGCLLRGVIKGYVPPIPFVIVTLISTLVILSAGRAGYTFLTELYVEMF